MKLRSIMQKVPKRLYALLAIATAAIVVPAGLLAWGPDRKEFTVANPAPYVTFNSIKDNPNIGGSEFNFVGIRENGTNGKWQDNQTVQPGKEYVVRVYVHNNAAENLKLVAKGVKAFVNLPTTTAKSIEVQGSVYSSNAKPNKVYDHANFTASQEFNLAYVPGTLKYYNNANGNGFTIPESIFTNQGAALGYKTMNGEIPGCFQYAGYLTFIVKPQFAATPNFTAEKLVSKHGENKWVDNYVAQPGEKVDFLLKYKNTSSIQQDDVTFRDTLPSKMSYVAGSTIYGNSQHPSGTPASDNVTKNGINVGSYAAGANAWAIFSATVANKDALECGTNKLVNKVTVTTKQGGSKDDTATVEVTKECTPPKKVEACNLKTLKIEQVEESKIDNVNYTLDLKKCEKKPELVTACNLDTKKIEQNVEKSKIDNVHYTLDLEKCKTPEDKDIKVCRLSDKKYPVTIKESQFDATKYSKNPEDCKTPEEKTIEVCRLSDKKYPVTIKESEFDSTKYSKNPNDCKETPPVEKCEVPGKEDLPKDSPDCKETPPTEEEKCTVPGKEHLPADSDDCKEDEAPEVEELPETGATESILSLLGAGSLVGVASAYVASRRK